MEDQHGVEDKGGTMRLGAWDCELTEDTLAYKTYGGAVTISERHRHRYEFNNDYKAVMEDSGMVFSGINADTGLAEARARLRRTSRGGR